MAIDSKRSTEPSVSTSAPALIVWVLVAALTTTVLVVLRDDLDKAHFALVYLLIVLFGAARVGRRAGIGLAILCFVCFNFFLLPPYHTLSVADSRDWLVLAAFLVTSMVAAQLLYQAQYQAAEARARNQEMNRLSTLGAETLSVGRAEDATVAIARVIQSTLGIGACELFEADDAGVTFQPIGQATRDGFDPASGDRTREMLDYVAQNGAVVVQRLEGAVHVLEADAMTPSEALTQSDAIRIVMPLTVRDRVVGILVLADDKRIRLHGPELRFAQTLAYYAALGVERVRLTAEADRAAAARAANQLKDAFVAAASHDLRTPLTTIKGIAHELASAGHARARTIEQEADRLNRLVADLLDLSRLNAGGLQPEPELNTAEDLVGAALNQLSGLDRANDIRVHLPEHATFVGHFDFVHSLRALVNLVENALKYSAPESPVEITIQRVDDQLVFAVADHGPGVTAGDEERIFEPFVRGDNINASSGAGLGLAIARRLARAQGGSVSYQPRPGGGSVFSLSVPAADIDDLNTVT